MGGGRQRRITTGVPGLDTLLYGGLLPGSSYVVTGGPGTGKTVLCSQIAFHRATLGEQVLYVSTFSESHSRLLSNLSSMTFCDEAAVGTRITLQSAIATLESGGLDALLASIHETVRKRRVSLLVVDTLLTLAETADTDYDYRRFLRELGTALGMNDCTSLLIAPALATRAPVEQFICDGVFELRHEGVGMREVREIEVTKFRGSRVLGGLHTGRITADGWQVYPRLEALPLPGEPLVRTGPEPLRFGIAGLDDMLGGGVRAGAVSAVMGAPGSGKTLLGLNFLAEGLRRGEPALYFGFYERPDRLVAKAGTIGLELEAHLRSGRLTCEWHQPVEQLLDALAHRLLALVRERRPTRVFIDGVDGMLLGAAHPQRFPGHFAALANHLRALGVATVTSVETSYVGRAHGAPQIEFSTTVENIIHLRFVEAGARIHRLVSILKLRESSHDPAMREFRVTPQGLLVASDATSAQALLERSSGPAGAAAGAASRSPRRDGEGGA